MLQSYLIGRLPVAMATVSNIRLHCLVHIILIHPLPKYGKHFMFRFMATFVPVLANKRPRVVTIEPDQNY